MGIPQVGPCLLHGLGTQVTACLANTFSHAVASGAQAVEAGALQEQGDLPAAHAASPSLPVDEHRVDSRAHGRDLGLRVHGAPSEV